MIITRRLTNEELDSIEEITRVYKIELGVLEEDYAYGGGSDIFQDYETGEIMNLENGVSQILDVINTDDRELFNTIDNKFTVPFEHLCKQLNLI